ncbi:putative transcription factor FAR family [Helianthus annuus]|nr:putative transcription factor FAR family [Helianthus annuus]KAJ0617673.1 putative transcription factor FAR family [Helianthus annuus]KAJ0776211.1 putative transcription factor FAR family [Helianthus annuus]
MDIHILQGGSIVYRFRRWYTDFGYSWLRLTHLVLNLTHLVLKLNLRHLMIIIQHLFHIIHITMLVFAARLMLTSNVNVNPISALGPSDVDVNTLPATLPAVNPNESYNPVFTTVANPVANRHTLHGFEIQTLDSMFTLGNVGSETANLPDQSLSVDTTSTGNTTSTGTAPTSTEHQHLQFIRFETKVDVRYLPMVNSTFTHWEDIVMMYNTYATQPGFSTRIGTSKNKKYHDNPNMKICTHRYILCSREGQPRVTESDPNTPSKNAPTIYDKSKKQHRRSRFTVFGCRARIKVSFDRDTEQYKIYGFIAAHNHCMIGSDHANMLKQNRKLGFEEQQFIHNVSLNKIGPTVAHNIQASLKGGPQNVHGTTEDFKNCSKDIRAFISERDADILLHTMRSRVTNLNDFYFDCVIVDNELRSFFWADFVSLRNYEAFGDVCAFDATYDTNKYRMIFVPFTGVDHHKKCVIFGAGMLYDETIESYTWLLNTFLAAHKKQPIFVLTDQDASMKQAVSTVFTNSIHRLCIWHIMRKLPSNISNDILDNTTLRSSIHKLVWNLFITPQTFEERWHVLMDEYHLDNHPWLCEMFAIRHE